MTRRRKVWFKPRRCLCSRCGATWRWCSATRASDAVELTEKGKKYATEQSTRERLDALVEMWRID